MDKTIYFDYAATTPTKKEVVEEMIPYFTQDFGNPSSIYSIANKNKEAIMKSRDRVAKAINANNNEVYFTGSGTEADNWAIKGIAESYRTKGKHIITSRVEHHAVLHTCEYLEKNGYEVTYLDVDKYGMISIDDLRKAIRDDTILITIMYANNEIGTIQPINDIGAIAKENNIIFHTDAVQALGAIDIDVKASNIDLLSMSAHKIYGPKGVGALYIRKGVKIKAFIHGGAQEKRRRAGTENVPGIVGFAKALELIVENREKNNERIIKLRDRLIKEVTETVPHCHLNGHPTKRLPNNVNFSFSFIEGESLLIMLDMKGICASSGSACTSGSLDPSHVLMAIGLPHETAHGSLRITLGEDSTEEDIDYLIEVLSPIVKRLREMSPLYEDFVKNNK
ncbi:MAG: cysteine desulfurase NifS [Eubacteriales bacterium]